MITLTPKPLTAETCSHHDVVAAAWPTERSALRAFSRGARQGVSHHRRVWPHALLVFRRVGEFVVFDPGADDASCDRHRLPDNIRIMLDPAREDR